MPMAQNVQICICVYIYRERAGKRERERERERERYVINNGSLDFEKHRLEGSGSRVQGAQTCGIR